MQFNITIALVILTVIVSIGAFNSAKTKSDMIFHPPSVRDGQWYRFFSSGLIHADQVHLIFNMIALWSFGGHVEMEMGRIFGETGRWIYLLMYVSALLVSLLPTYFKHRDDHYYYGLGASGAVSAVLFAGMLLAPENEVFIIFLPFFGIPGFLFAPLYILFSAYLDRKGNDNINHSAHIWGGLYGLAFLIISCRIVNFNVLKFGMEAIKNYMKTKGWIG